ncbi:MAG: hypothetical protein HRU76_14205 [Phycisphaeraceae bacterium]|nr:hypothetical protein [Phycisphaerales bacterium]QOJ18664.1 MAG: hypothetical protein HRU76_14205 [Phycisphaeraceae bacterium]
MSQAPIAITQTGDYIPRKDALFRDWAANFAALVQDDPEELGISPAKAEHIRVLTERFAEALERAVQPSKRTTTAVRHKNDTRRELERLLRTYAQQIKNLAGIGPGLLSELGLHVDDPHRSPVRPPRTSPILRLPGGGAPGEHIILYADTLAPCARRKPRGAAYIQIYAVVADRIVPDVRFAHHVGDFSRVPIRVSWPVSEAGRTATYFGRWCNRKGEHGPWGLPMSSIITGAGSRREAAAPPLQPTLRVPVMAVRRQSRQAA